MPAITAGDAIFIAAALFVTVLITYLANRSRKEPGQNAVPSGSDVSDAALRGLLTGHRSVALVGASPDPARPSHKVMLYLLQAGYTVYPVNPQVETILEHKVYRSLAELPQAPDIVDVFRRSAEVPQIAREAVERGARVLWLQEGVISPEGMRIARAGGLTVVMNHCIGKEHRRLVVAKGG